MAKFRMKPVVIEAVQLTWENWSEMCDFAGVGRLEDNKPTGTDKDINNDPLPDGGPGLLIPTLAGLMLGMPGDWIIRGVQGELYPIKEDVFLETYEAVEIS